MTPHDRPGYLAGGSLAPAQLHQVADTPEIIDRREPAQVVISRA